MRLSEKNYKRIVIKIGSSLFYSDKKKLDFALLAGIADQVAHLILEKKEVIIVSSGAIALGMSVLGLHVRPTELSSLQAIAAIGQNELMSTFCRLFDKKGLKCGQVLLTWEDFNDRARYLNAKNTILKLLDLGAVPVINENDTISTAEIKFGDNDQLSALVSGLCNADLLVMLSDVDGLLMKDKKTVVALVEEITPQIKALASPTDKSTSVGGMITKIKAAKICVDSGIPCVIANGRRKDIVLSVVKSAQGSGTLFLPKDGPLAAKDRWIAFGAKPKGKVTVDAGAKKALLSNKSLLSVGVCGIEGNFECSDVVSVVDEAGNEFARGKVCFSSVSLDKIKGKRSEKEVMHCDNIVVL